MCETNVACKSLACTTVVYRERAEIILQTSSNSIHGSYLSKTKMSAQALSQGSRSSFVYTCIRKKTGKQRPINKNGPQFLSKGLNPISQQITVFKGKIRSFGKQDLSTAPDMRNDTKYCIAKQGSNTKHPHTIGATINNETKTGSPP